MKTLLPSLSATRVFLLFAAVMLGLAAGPVMAQTTGTLDTTFPDVNVSGFVATGTFPNIVYAAIPQTDGKLILGGNFSSIAGVPRGTLARLNLDQSVDMSFAPSTDGVVYCVAVQPDGKILVGGIFSQVTPGVARSRLARFNADGSLDAGFNAGLISGSGDTAVFGITVQADSKILINGDFSSVAGTARNGVARLNADGSMDPGFTAAGGTISGSPGNVLSLALRPDGKILVGGGFSEMNGAPHNGIALLNANGTVDNAYTTSAANTFAMAIQPNGQVLISGFFSSVNGTPRSGNARLNADGSVEAGYISSRTVPTFSLQTDGRVMTSAVCLSPNGTTSFFVTVNGPNTPTCASHQADGKILLGGDFTGIGGVTRRGLARVYNSETAVQSVALPDSDRVQWFRSGTMPEVTRVTFELSTNGGASWSALGAGVRIAGGWEYNGGGLPASGMVRARGFTKSGYFTGSQGLIEQVKTYTGFPPIVVAPTSTAITSTSATLGGLVSSDGGAAITERGVVLSRSVSNGDPVIGGPNVVKIPTAGTTGIFTVSATGLIPAGDYFFRAYATNANGTIYTNPVATFTALPAGLVDAAYNPNVGSGQVTATAVQSDGKTIVGGTFTTVGGAAHANLARVNADGSVDATFNPTVNSGTRAVAVQFDGKIVIGGGFTQVNGSTRDGLARLNADGTLDTTFNPGAPGVTGLALAADGKIVIGGSFTTVAGTGRNRIARLNADGTLDATFDPGTGADDEVLSVSVRASGVVVIGGLFTTVNGTSRVRIAQLFPSGGVDLTFDPGSGANGVVNCVIADENNNVLIGGDFTTVNGQARNRLARLLPTGFLEPKFDAFLNINAAVRSIAVQENGSVLVGGGFTMVNGVARNGLARLTSYGTLDSALDPGAGGVVSSVALQGDGQILVGGNFTTFNGTARNRLARLTNALPVQSLTAISATRVEWVRNGSLPVLSLPPILEISTNGGASWAFAGTGARSEYNKWDFNGLGLPASGLVRARGRTSGGQYNGSSGLVEQQIAVSFPIPTVTSPGSTSITSNSAALGGFISNNGGSATTEYGVVYAPTAVNSNPLIGGAGVTRISAAAGGFVGGFQVNASGLSAGTAYTFRAYATTNAGTGYTGAAAFATLASAPSIGLPTSANVTFNSATLGGTVAADGGSSVTERGVVFSATATNGNPLIGGAGVTKLTSAGTIGTFTVSATGLSVSTGYSFKAYAVNALGTSYTAPVSTFTTSPAPSGVGLPEPGYDPNVAGTTVVAIAVQPDGKAIIAGTFSTVGGVAHQNIARLNANGSVDGTLNTTLNSSAYSVAVQADGKILVGGGFSLVNGAVSPELARLNADGTLESTATFNIGNGRSVIWVDVDWMEP